MGDIPPEPQNQEPSSPSGPAAGDLHNRCKPHRGAVVLALGIVGFFCCICGIIAWVMGSNDLNEMQAGTMDPSGRDLTKAGKICGMISVILAIASGVAYLLMFAGVAATM